MHTPTLLPCPFCGGKAFLHDDPFIEGRGAAFVECGECSVTKEGDYEEPLSAITSWNRRVPVNSLEPMREALAKPVVFQVEGSEGVIRLSIGCIELCAFPDGTPEAIEILRFDALRRAALAEGA